MSERGEPGTEADLDAGPFSGWLTEMLEALRGARDSEVPCNGCTACCRSSQFVHVGPDETDTLAHIPPPLLFPAPSLPKGHVLLGYDERGHCPMLVDDRCSIYAHRPRACRTYDCRIFSATGIAVDDDKVEVGERVRRWRFTVSSEADWAQREAVHAAARFIEEHARDLGPALPPNAAPRAVLAVEVHDLFLDTSTEADALIAEIARRLAGGSTTAPRSRG